MKIEVAKIHCKRIKSIIKDIEHLRNREDLAIVQDELDKAIDHSRNAIEILESLTP